MICLAVTTRPAHSLIAVAVMSVDVNWETTFSTYPVVWSPVTSLLSS